MSEPLERDARNRFKLEGMAELYRAPLSEDPTKPDPRRGIWMRVTANAIEMCAGREGDDDHLILKLGATVTLDDLEDARNVLSWVFSPEVEED